MSDLCVVMLMMMCVKLVNYEESKVRFVVMWSNVVG